MRIAQYSAVGAIEDRLDVADVLFPCGGGVCIDVESLEFDSRPTGEKAPGPFDEVRDAATFTALVESATSVDWLRPSPVPGWAATSRRRWRTRPTR